MANLLGRDFLGNQVAIKANGDGTTTPLIIYHDIESRDIKTVSANITSSTDLVAAVSGKSIRVVSMFASTTVNGSAFKLQTGASTDITAYHTLNVGDFLTRDSVFGLCQTVAGEKLRVVCSGTIAIDIAYKEI